MKILSENGRLTEYGKEFVSHFESDLDAIFLSHEFIMMSDGEKLSLEAELKSLVAEKFSKNRLVRQKLSEQQKLAQEFEPEDVVLVSPFTLDDMLGNAYGKKGPV